MLAFPLLSLAQSATFDGGNEFAKFFGGVTKFIQEILIPILLALAFVVFIFGLIKYFFVTGSDGGAEKDKGKSLMLWGIVGFVAIVSVWGIVSLVAGGLGFEDQDLENIPDVPGVTS